MQRFFDIIFSIAAILIFSPILLSTCIILRITGEGEVFYRQARVGKAGKEFQILKFATMLKDSPNMLMGTITVQNDPRVLPIGRILRKTKINELPQIINVLLGDMSFVGPRPQTRECFETFEENAQKEILSVLPGLSGIGSLYFRDEEAMMSNASNAKTFYSDYIMRYKGELEKWYVKNRSLSLYFKIMILTARIVVTSESATKVCNFKDLPKEPPELRNFFT